MKALATHTLHELQILPREVGERSILDLLNQAYTHTGKDQIRKLLSSPLTALSEIQQRQELFQCIADNLTEIALHIPRSYMTAATNHLDSNLAWNSAKTWLQRYRLSLWYRWFSTHDFYRLLSGTAALQKVLRTIDERTAWWRDSDQLPYELQQCAQVLRTFFNHAQPKLTIELDQISMIRVDFFLRQQYVDQVKAVLAVFSQLDAYCGIARFLQTVQWSYPSFIQTQEPTFSVTAMKHPLLVSEKAVGNDFSLSHPQRLALLTGGNMSGKTTFLKTCGLVLYLAHLGLPVPAGSASLSFFDRLMTSIHLSDSLEMGYSHFYTELMRIRDVARALADGQRVFLLADELFRGTNPQDAVLCARQVIDALVQLSGSLFLISSHLPQLGTPYEKDTTVQFNCFKTNVLEGRLVFTHKIEAGITEEQTGLLLLKQTGVLSDLQ